MRLATKTTLLALLLTASGLLSACGDKDHDPRPGKGGCSKHTPPPPPAGGNS